MRSLSSVQLPALTRLFSAAVLREMARKGESTTFRRLVELTDMLERVGQNATVGDVFDSAFEILKIGGHRDEYVYRAAVTQKILMGTHSLRTASMLNEFRVGNCKADLVILNGTATVYEIKSERDSLARLANQVKNYRRVFATVNVIASESHIQGVVNTVPAEVGVMCLSKRYRISVVREAVSSPALICPVTVFESLRISESIAILQSIGVKVPELPNTQKHGALRDLFAKLDPIELHFEMVRTLKRTRELGSLSEFVQLLPRSLQTAALSIKLRRSEHPRLIKAIATPLRVAMTWS